MLYLQLVGIIVSMIFAIISVAGIIGATGAMIEEISDWCRAADVLLYLGLTVFCILTLALSLWAIITLFGLTF